MRSDHGGRNKKRAPLCKALHKPARWCRCSCSPRGYLGQLERERIRCSETRNGRFAMLVLSRKNQESVVVGGADGFHRLFRVKVLEIRGTT